MVPQGIYSRHTVGRGWATPLALSVGWFSANLLDSRYCLTGGTGTYALTGNASRLLRGYKVRAATGTYALTGNAARLLSGRKIAAARGAYSLTGNAARLLVGRRLTAGRGSYILTGNASRLLATRLLRAGSGVYVLTGVARLLAGRKMVASPGAYVLSGQPARLFRGYTLVAGRGAYLLTGDAARLLTDRIMRVGAGAFVLTGIDARLIAQKKPYTGIFGRNFALLATMATAVDQPATRNRYQLFQEDGTPMTSIVMKRGDRRPVVNATLKEPDGSVVDLTGCSVRFLFRRAFSRDVAGGGAATVVSAAGGQVRYSWAPGDTDVPGNYQAEWEVTDGSGLVETYPNGDYIQMVVNGDLG